MPLLCLAAYVRSLYRVNGASFMALADIFLLSS
jgi:hypothetical protein